MKKILVPVLFLMLFITTFVEAQQSTHTSFSIDARLYEVFEFEYLEKVKADNPFLIQRWNFYLDNSWFITDLPAEKAAAGYPTIQIANDEKFNIFLLEKQQKLTRDWDKQTVYMIGDSGKALVFLSGKEFNSRLNEHLER